MVLSSRYLWVCGEGDGDRYGLLRQVVSGFLQTLLQNFLKFFEIAAAAGKTARFFGGLCYLRIKFISSITNNRNIISAPLYFIE